LAAARKRIDQDCDLPGDEGVGFEDDRRRGVETPTSTPALRAGLASEADRQKFGLTAPSGSISIQSRSSIMASAV